MNEPAYAPVASTSQAEQQPSLAGAVAKDPSRRKSKHYCIITTRGQPCKSCVSRRMACTFDEPPTARVRKLPSASSGVAGNGKGREETPGGLADSGMHDAAVQGLSMLSSGADLSDVGGKGKGRERDPSSTLPLFPVNFGPSPSPSLNSVLSLLHTAQTTSTSACIVPASPQLETSLLTATNLHYIAPRAFHDYTLTSASASSSIDPPSTDSSRPTHPTHGSLRFLQVAPRSSALPVHFVQSSHLVYGRALHSTEDVFRKAVAPLEGEMVEKLVELFRTQTQPAFPIFAAGQLAVPEGVTGLDVLSALHQSGLSYGCIVAILAHATTYLPSSRTHHKSLWRHALQLLEDEYRTPSLQTVQLGLVTLTARPALNVGANTVAMSRLVGAAHLLGLHVDPSSWRIPVKEKKLRKKLWWLVVVQDKWRSLWYGRPSNVSFDDTNVALPTLDDFTSPSAAPTPEEAASAESFVALCKLTVIVDNILCSFYTLRAQLHPLTLSTALSRLSGITNDLALLDASLSPALRNLPKPEGEGQAVPPTGVRSFQLAMLGVQLVVMRLTRGVLEKREAEGMKKGEKEMIELAEAVVEFVENLATEDLTRFWSPYCPFILTSTSALLLRLSLSSLRSPPTSPTPPPSSVLLTRLLVALLSLHHIHQWDVASLALDILAGQLRSLSEGEVEGLGLGRVMALFAGEGAHTDPRPPLLTADAASSSFPEAHSATDLPVPPELDTLPAVPLPSHSDVAAPLFPVPPVDPFASSASFPSFPLAASPAVAAPGAPTPTGSATEADGLWWMEYSASLGAFAPEDWAVPLEGWGAEWGLGGGFGGVEGLQQAGEDVRADEMAQVPE
ncbi:hypothetical protein JCM8097_008203 [Rhodosporidiobolus ruineniae]